MPSSRYSSDGFQPGKTALTRLHNSAEQLRTAPAADAWTPPAGERGVPARQWPLQLAGFAGLQHTKLCARLRQLMRQPLQKHAARTFGLQSGGPGDERDEGLPWQADCAGEWLLQQLAEARHESEQQPPDCIRASSLCLRRV